MRMNGSSSLFGALGISRVLILSALLGWACLPFFTGGHTSVLTDVSSVVTRAAGKDCSEEPSILMF